jgi:hypothetical protein
MPYTLTNARDHVWRILRDVGDDEDHQLLTNTEIDAFIAQAMAVYSLRFPVAITADVVADGTRYTALPVGWEPGLSTLTSIEWPVGENPTSLIDPRLRSFYLHPTQGNVLYWADARPASGATVRYTFTASAVLSDTALDTTLPSAHFYPLCDLAASLCADSIAAKYAQMGEPVINVDVASYQKTNDWLSLARRLGDRYRVALGLGAAGDGGGGSQPAAGYSTTVNWDSRTVRGDYLVHRRSIR